LLILCYVYSSPGIPGQGPGPATQRFCSLGGPGGGAGQDSSIKLRQALIPIADLLTEH
jgi:hypothetical protein